MDQKALWLFDCIILTDSAIENFLTVRNSKKNYVIRTAFLLSSWCYVMICGETCTNEEIYEIFSELLFVKTF